MENKIQILIVTGQSGAGKSQAIASLEDMGYYCVDNLPPALLLDLCKQIIKNETIKKIAVACDIRTGQFFSDLEGSLDKLKDFGLEYKILFLEAGKRTILKRYQETRRVHPLDKNGNTEDAIDRELEMLAGVRGKADYIVDTSEYNNAALYTEIERLLLLEDSEKFGVSIFSFGYKYGMPQDADWVLDARFLPNPFYVESLKKLTGKNKKVKDYVLGFFEARDFVARITGLVVELIPKYKREGKHHLTIAIGCTGGKHRSVVIAEELAVHLVECGIGASIKHRELK